MRSAQKIREASLAAYESIRQIDSLDARSLPCLFFKNFVLYGGLELEESVWRPGSVKVLSERIEMAITSGTGSSKAAADLVYSGAVHDLVYPDAQELLELVSSIFQTEINRAHGEAFMAIGERTPGFAGWRFLLSPQHSVRDICDLLAAQNLHGLGPGVYPDRPSCPWPAHPKTQSYVEIVFSDEITTG